MLALALTRRFLPESRETVRRGFPDPWGVLLLAGSLTLVALGIVQGNQWHWLSARTLGAIALGLVVLAAFVRRTLRVATPALDLTLFADRSFRWANVATAVFTIGFTAMFFASIQFTTQVWHYSILRAGLAMIPGPLVVVLLAPRMGRLAAAYGQRALLVPGGLIWAGTGVWQLSLMSTTPDWAAHMLPASLLGGLGVAMVLPQLMSAATQHLPPDERGVGSAVNQAIRQFGATFGVALTVALLGVYGPVDALGHFQRVWWMLLLSGVFTSVAALWLPRRGATREVAPELAPALAVES
jgi:MFS family permease